jgi:hypothetical protein
MLVLRQVLFHSILVACLLYQKHEQLVMQSIGYDSNRCKLISLSNALTPLQMTNTLTALHMNTTLTALQMTNTLTALHVNTT